MIKTVIVEKLAAPCRLQDFALKHFKQVLVSNKAVKKAIKTGLIIVNGIPSNTGYFVQLNDVISLCAPTDVRYKPFRIQLELVYEDDFLAIINKPAGIATSGNRFKTIYNALGANLSPSNADDALIRFTPLHRLDRATSGLLLIAKTKFAQIELSRAFEEKTIHKAYHALIRGKQAEEGIIQDEIEGKQAKTLYATVQVWRNTPYGPVSLLKLSPITGRTHQLRIHLANQNTPILGDPLYGDIQNRIKGRGLFLCATDIKFQHPETKEWMEFSIPFPKKFKMMMDRLAGIIG